MKRLISWVLALVMILGMVPAVAFLAEDVSAAESGTYTVVQEKAMEIVDSSSTKYEWYKNNGYTDSAENYIEIVADGCNDAGALHVYQADTTVTDMQLALYTDWISEGTYTLKMNVKGDLGGADQTNRFYPAGSDSLFSNINVLAGTYDVSSWTEVSQTVQITSGAAYFIYSFSKYNWATDMYIDNVQLVNSNGVNMLGNAGNFYTLEEVSADSADTNQWPDAAALDTATIANAYGGTLTGVWTPMYPSGTPGEDTWAEWNDTHYAEVAADGYKDAGSLHLVSTDGNNTGIAINAGMTVGETYTLGFYAKGTVNTGKVLGMYANGDGTIIGATETFGAGWNYYEHTFTAGLSQINIVAANWGSVDIYVDNITLKNSTGVDLLAGCGDFYTDEDPNAVRVPAVLAQSAVGAYGAYTGQWAIMYPAGTPDEGTWAVQDASSHYAEIVADGYKNTGALHIKSNSNKNAGVAINAGMTVGETYTVGLWAKGTSNSGKVLAIYDNGNPVIIGASAELTADWSYYSISFTATQSQINLFASDWGVTDIYIDHITLKNSAGVDLLDGYGDFYTLAEPDEEESFQIYDSDPGESYQWFNGTGYTASDDMYIKLVDEGADDNGALHIYQADGVVAAEDMRLHMQINKIPAGTYTLQYNIKGSDLGITTTNDACRFYIDKNSDLTTQFRNLAGAKTVSQWTTLSETVTTTEESSYIVLGISKYVCGIDCYVDNVKLLDSNGNDLLKGQGNFCVYETATIADSNPDTNYEWFNHNGYVNNSTKTLEIVEDGANDAGSVHVYQPDGQTADADMIIGIRVDCVPVGEYTLQYNIKGTDLGNTDVNSNKFYLHENSDLTNQFRVAAGTKTLSDWTTVSETFTTTSDVYYIFLMVSKYVNGADYYVDNVKLLDASGKDYLNGAGNFCVAPQTSIPEPEPTDPEPTETDPPATEPDGPNVPTGDAVSGTADVLDTSRHSWERLSHQDAWTPFFPSGINADTNWTAWETESENAAGYNYAEIAAIGKTDAGSLHFVRGDVYENVGVAFDAGMTIGETYTLKAYVKGYAKATYGGLQLYGNGDGVLATFGADGTVANNTDWTEVTHTFTATRATLEMLVGGGAYLVDIYMDDLQIIDANGNNILGNAGNFSVTEKDIPDLAVISSAGPERILRWYWNTDATSGVACSSSVNNGLQVIEEGCDDPGALYIWQNQMSQDIYLGLLNAMASDLENNQTYTLSFSVKGVFCNEEALGVYPAYLSQDVVGNGGDMNIQKKLLSAGYSYNANNQIVVTDWTELTFELPYNGGENGFMYLNLFMSKYTHGSRFYLDNVQVLDPNGNDMLCGAGNFMDSGSESYPILLPKDGGTVYNSNTMYYMVYCDSASVSISNHVESGITCGDQNFSVTHNGVTQSASSKNVTMQMASAAEGEPIVFAVTSTASGVEIPEGTLEMIQRAGEFNIYDVVITDTSCKHTNTTTTTVNASCTAAGSVTVTCNACGQTVSTEEIPANGHTEVIDAAVEAACITTGLTEGSHCSVCGEIIVAQEEVPAKGHSYVGDTTPADCENDGKTVYTCSACGDSYEETIPAGHNIEYVAEVIPANCQETGHSEYWYCAGCDCYFGDAEGSYQVNPAWINYTGEHIRPEGVAVCAIVPCELCGEDSYGESCVRDEDVPVCQDTTCVNCGETIYGWGCNYNTGDEEVPAPLCQPGDCVYCGTHYEKLYDCENGAWADCLDGECSYGCGKQFPATSSHTLENPCEGGQCQVCWNQVEGAHSYESVVTPPTATEQGYTTHTCSVCGDSYVDSYTDPVVPETPTVNLRFAGASLVLKSDLTMNFKVNERVQNQYENIWVEFEMNGVTTVMTEGTISGTDLIFAFQGIAPRMIKDNIAATMHGTFDGVEYVYTLNYSAYKNLNNLLSSGDSVLQTLVVDLLNYGTAHQIYMDYNTDTLINADLTDEQKAWGTTADPTLENITSGKYVAHAAPTASFKAPALKLSNAVEMVFTLNCANLTDMTGVALKIEIDDGDNGIITYTVDAADFEYDATANTYKVYFKNLLARQLRCPVYATIMQNGEAISHTMRYSVESYAYSAQNNTTVTGLADLVKAMMRYGDSTYAYVNG